MKMAKLVCLMVIVAVTSPMYAATMFTEDFSGAAMPANMESNLAGSASLDGLNHISFAGGNATWDMAGNRQYVRTIQSDYSSVNFRLEATITIAYGPWGGAYIGLGEGLANPAAWGEPTSGKCLLAVLFPTGFGGNLDGRDNGIGPFLATGGAGDGTHRLRFDWNATTKVAAISIDKNYTGGSFVASATATLNGSDNGFTTSNSHLVFGGGENVIFDDISVVANPIVPTVTINADNPNIQYTGRIDFSDPLSPLLTWSGSSVVANFQGTSIKAILNDMAQQNEQGGSKGQNYFYSIIDNGTPALIVCAAGTQTYNIASGLSDTTHKIELYKRTEGRNGGAVAFKGFIVDDGKALTTPPARPIRKIEFYGDSVTSGLALDDTADNQDNPYCNNYLAYGSITARNLNAEHHTISISGVGIVKSWWDANMPNNYYYRLNAVNGSSNWNFSQWTPDCIVINLGQNDYWLGVTQAQAVPAFVNFVNTLRTKYNDMTAKRIPIILALGSMNATATGSPWPGYIQQAVDSLKSTYSDNNVYKLIFPYNGISTHPHAPEHAAMAQQLTDFIISNIPGFSLSIGDINNDGYVDNLDFALLSKRWLETGCGPCSGADLSGDNNVTMIDFSILAQNWLR